MLIQSHHSTLHPFTGMDGTMYKDLGCDHFDRRSTNQQKKRLVKRLADLGYTVEIKPVEAMA